MVGFRTPFLLITRVATLLRGELVKGSHTVQDGHTPRGRRRIQFASLFVVLSVCLWCGSSPPKLNAAPNPYPPVIDEPIVATVYGGPVTLHGAHLGDASSLRSIRFDYGTRSQTLLASSPLVQTWEANSVTVTLPPEVQSGRLTITVEGATSNAVDLLVYSYQTIPDPPTAGTNKAELALAVAANGAVWVNQEFHLELKSFAPDGAYQALTIPQAAGPGIFAMTLFGDTSTHISILGEDITVAGDGKVWFTEGGAQFYSGRHYNSSRIVSYDPASGVFQCFNAPLDNAQVMGVVIDEGRGMVWYSESGFEYGAAISGFQLNSTLSDCAFDPSRSDPRDPICPGALPATCHWRFPLPSAISWPAHLALDAQGNIWFTESIGNKVARWTPETGQLLELPLPAPIVRSGPGSLLATSGPGELTFDTSGDLWVSEFFDATIAHVRPSLLKTENCLALDSAGNNPCIAEAVVTSNGSDGKTLHTVSAGADGMLWFGVQDASLQATIGFIDTSHGNAVGFLPPIAGLGSAAGVVQDPVSHDIWIAQFWDHAVGRLRQLGAGDADGDGVPDASDTCVIAANPDQADLDHNGIGDACDDPDIDHDGLSNAYEVNISHTNPLVADTDGDGCADTAELQDAPGSENTGGLRDPNNPWDYFNPSGDRRIMIDDLVMVLRRFGVRAGYPDYDPKYDRSFLGPRFWDLGPPDGKIQLFDILAVMSQFGDLCD